MEDILSILGGRQHSHHQGVEIERNPSKQTLQTNPILLVSIPWLTSQASTHLPWDIFTMYYSLFNSVHKWSSLDLHFLIRVIVPYKAYIQNTCVLVSWLSYVNSQAKLKTTNGKNKNLPLPIFIFMLTSISIFISISIWIHGSKIIYVWKFPFVFKVRNVWWPKHDLLLKIIWICYKYCVHMYVSGKMVSVETIPGLG
jgi:hypothetical protein